MNPKLVHALAAGDLKDIADVLFSLHLIDGEVYEELKLQTKTMHQIARDFDMNRMKDFSKLLDVLRKQKGIEHLVVFMKTRCRKLCVLDSSCDKMISLLDFITGTSLFISRKFRW